MKTIFLTVVLLLFIFSNYSHEQVINKSDDSTSPEQIIKHKNDTSSAVVTYQTFYDDLSPYGDWVYFPQYGNVWVPFNNDAFTPYCNDGHWVYTNDGWAWFSDYSWGWAPFHYGRWFYDNYYGWAWIPGYNWAPAWVRWGVYDNFYCWAPLGPGIEIGIDYFPPLYYWNFVSCNYIDHTKLSKYVKRNMVNDNNKITNINDSHVYSDHAYYIGPRKEDVEKITKTKIAAVSISETSKPGLNKLENNKLVVYRPMVNKNETVNSAPKIVKTPYSKAGNNSIKENNIFNTNKDDKSELKIVPYQATEKTNVNNNDNIKMSRENRFYKQSPIERNGMNKQYNNNYFKGRKNK